MPSRLIFPAFRWKVSTAICTREWQQIEVNTNNANKSTSRDESDDWVTEALAIQPKRIILLEQMWFIWNGAADFVNWSPSQKLMPNGSAFSYFMCLKNPVRWQWLFINYTIPNQFQVQIILKCCVFSQPNTWCLSRTITKLQISRFNRNRFAWNLLAKS